MRRAVGPLGLFALISLSSATLPAQDPAPAGQAGPPVFRTSADLVIIDAVVTDGDGRHVIDLTRDDFEVTVAGKRQELEQAIYIRTEDQPRVLSAARAVVAPAHPSSAEAPAARSRASQTLKQTALAPDRIARTIALVVDDLGLSFESTFNVRKVLHKYIDTQMQPGDLVAIVRTAGGIGTLQQFTTDKRLLHLAADRVRWDFRSRHRVGSFDAIEPAGADFGGLDALRDSLASVGTLGALEYIARGVMDLPGRKCIVFFSEGFPSIFRDREESGRIWRAMTRMLGRANAAGVVVYTIDARGLQTAGLTAEDNLQGPAMGTGGGGGGSSPPAGASSNSGGSGGSGGGSGGSGAADRDRPPAGARGSGAGFLDVSSSSIASASNGRLATLVNSQESLHFIANQTGGLAVENTNDLNLGIQRVLADQHGYYLLGYVAPKGAVRSGWDQNRVKVRVKRPGLRVRARQGFFGPSDPNEPAGPSYDPLIAAALSPFASTGIAVRLSSFFWHDTKDGAYVRSLLFIDSNDLQWAEDTPGRHTATFEVSLLAVGDNGQVVAAWRRVVPVALGDGQFRLARERGILYSSRTPVGKPGAYQMRAAVHDVRTDATGSASQFLEVPEVGAGRLALSGVLLKGLTDGSGAPAAGMLEEIAPTGLADAVLVEPQIRILEPGTEAVYVYEIYDGLKASDAGGLQMATALIHDGQVVYQSASAPVNTPPRQGRKVRAIPIAGNLALGADMPAGSYTLEVTVRSRDGKSLEWKQWLEFEVRR